MIMWIVKDYCWAAVQFMANLSTGWHWTNINSLRGSGCPPFSRSINEAFAQAVDVL